MFRYFFFSLCLFVLGCSGYRFSRSKNPLAQYGISTLSVPVFYNFSNISQAHVEFTRETYRMLTQFSGITLINGYEKKADAVLFGILRSPEKLIETIKPSNLRLAQGNSPESIGTRRQRFYVPGSSDINLYLQIILIKKPNIAELEFIKSGMGHLSGSSAKIIFSENLPLRYQFTREILDNKGTEIIHTQNLGARNKSLKKMAENAAVTLRDMILYAF